MVKTHCRIIEAAQGALVPDAILTGPVLVTNRAFFRIDRQERLPYRQNGTVKIGWSRKYAHLIPLIKRLLNALGMIMKIR
jgi:hypothetical protein